MSTDDREPGSQPADQSIVLGKLSAPFGVKGWSKVTSYTDPPLGILEYKQWSVVKNGSARQLSVVEARPHGKFIIVKFDGVEDRDAAALLTHAEIRIDRNRLPDTEEGYYWVDLIGLEVVTTEAVVLGTVQSLMETGANDVLVVNGDRERLIPWIEGDVVQTVDLKKGSIVVDWDPEF